MFTWLKTKNLVEGFDRDAYDFLISGFNEVLEKEIRSQSWNMGTFGLTRGSNIVSLPEN